MTKSAPARRGTFPPQKRDDALRRARAGESCSGIARALGVSRSTVSRWCSQADPPVTFDRGATRAATAARVEDAKARRARISTGLLDDVDALRVQLFAERTRVHYSVTEGRQEYTAPPTPGELRDLAVSLGVLLDKHLALARFDSDDRELPAVDQWIAAMLGDPVAVAGS